MYDRFACDKAKRSNLSYDVLGKGIVRTLQEGKNVRQPSEENAKPQTVIYASQVLSYFD